MCMIKLDGNGVGEGAGVTISGGGGEVGGHTRRHIHIITMSCRGIDKRLISRR